MDATHNPSLFAASLLLGGGHTWTGAIIQLRHSSRGDHMGAVWEVGTEGTLVRTECIKNRTKKGLKIKRCLKLLG